MGALDSFKPPWDPYSHSLVYTQDELLARSWQDFYCSSYPSILWILSTTSHTVFCRSFLTTLPLLAMKEQTGPQECEWNLLLNTSKTKETVNDFHRFPPQLLGILFCHTQKQLHTEYKYKMWRVLVLHAEHFLFYLHVINISTQRWPGLQSMAWVSNRLPLKNIYFSKYSIILQSFNNNVHLYINVPNRKKRNLQQ